MLNQIGQEIAMTASDIIGHVVLITNENGIVIGASDRSRLQSFHEASVFVIKQRQALHHDDKAVKYLKGTRPGMTLPIEIGDNVVGTVGISGDPEDISRYGMLIKTMAELFLKERMELQSARLRDQNRQNLLREIVCFNPNSDEEAVIISHGHSLGYNLKMPRMATIIEIENPVEATGEREADISFDLNNSRAIKQVFDNPQHIRATMNDNRYIVFVCNGVHATEEDTVAVVKERCAELVRSFETRGIELRIGIGGLSTSLGAMRQSYYDAHQALAIGKMVRKQERVVYINDMFLEKLIFNIPKDSYERFYEDHLAKLCRQKDGDELCRVIMFWCESGFKATEAAKRLNIHKNTLAYRLARIEKFTALDLHDFKDALALYLTVSLHYLKDGAL